MAHIGEGRHGRFYVAVGHTRDYQSVLGQLRGTSGSDEKFDVDASLEEPRPEVTAEFARSNNEKLHGLTNPRLLGTIIR